MNAIREINLTSSTKSVRTIAGTGGVTLGSPAPTAALNARDILSVSSLGLSPDKAALYCGTFARGKCFALCSTLCCGTFARGKYALLCSTPNWLVRQLSDS